MAVRCAHIIDVIRLTQNGNDPINSIIWSRWFSKNIILRYASLHDMHISYETVAQSNFNDRKSYQGNRTIKDLSLKIQETTSNMFYY